MNTHHVLAAKPGMGTCLILSLSCNASHLRGRCHLNAVQDVDYSYKLCVDKHCISYDAQVECTCSHNEVEPALDMLKRVVSHGLAL